MNKIVEAEEIARIAKQFVPAKWLSIGNRIKWMIICALMWHLQKHEINDFRFAIDDKQTGSNSIDVFRSWMNGG